MPLLLGYVPGTDLDHGFFFYPSDQKIIGCDTTISTYIYIYNKYMYTHTHKTVKMVSQAFLVGERLILCWLLKFDEPFFETYDTPQPSCHLS